MYATGVNTIYEANRVSSRVQHARSGSNSIGFSFGDVPMKQIELTQGKIALVDNNMFEELTQFKWCAINVNNLWYAVRNIYKNNKWTILRMHREIMNAQNGQEIDHKNGNGLDNRHANLRFCTHSQNIQNQKVTKDGTSKYKGVSWHKQNKKWLAQIMLNDKQYYLGYFKSEIEAVKAYDKKAAEFFGEFARLNFP